MAYDIKLAKLVTGEMVIGKFNTETNSLEETAIMQTMPTKEGVQMMLLPYGYPFEQSFSASIDLKHAIHIFKNAPDEIQTKYLEAITKLTLATQQSGIITN